METFNDVEYSDNGKLGRAKSDVCIMGAPLDMGNSYIGGQDLAPTAIRDASIYPDSMGSIHGGVDAMKELKIVDCGDVDIVTGNYKGGLDAIRSQAAKVFSNTRFLITLGGDHSCSAKTLQAVADSTGGPVTLFHWDAHGDFDKHDESVDFNHGTWVRWCLENGLINRVVQVGTRGFGYSKQTLTWADKNDITIYPASSSGLMSKIQSELDQTSDPIYFSIDIDVLDPAFAPGVSHPEPGGLSSRELLKHIWMIVSDKKTVAMDVMEVTPARDQSELTVKIANRCVVQALTCLANTPR